MFVCGRTRLVSSYPFRTRAHGTPRRGCHTRDAATAPLAARTRAARAPRARHSTHYAAPRRHLLHCRVHLRTHTPFVPAHTSTPRCTFAPHLTPRLRACRTRAYQQRPRAHALLRTIQPLPLYACWHLPRRARAYITHLTHARFARRQRAYCGPPHAPRAYAHCSTCTLCARAHARRTLRAPCRARTGWRCTRMPPAALHLCHTSLPTACLLAHHSYLHL